MTTAEVLSPPSGYAGGREPVVSVRQLVKRFGDVEAVAGIDLDVRAGETFGFLGPNGAGKSTTIGILTTRVRQTSGTASVAGADVARTRVVRIPIVVVFPAPFGPRSPNSSPSGTSRSSESSATISDGGAPSARVPAGRAPLAGLPIGGVGPRRAPAAGAG